MKQFVFLSLLCLSLTSVQGQQSKKPSPFSGEHWGIVLENPDAEKVVEKKNIGFGTVGRPLQMDLYLPASIAANEKRSTIVILNGIGDQQGEIALKESASQTSWARLLAANGFVVITMESEVNKIRESFSALFKYLSSNGDQNHVDVNSIGVQAFSANCRESVAWLMSDDAFKGIKAATFYYGEAPAGPFRKDLPVFFVVAELDIRDNNYVKLWQEVLKNKSPWTITIADGMPHAFDCFSDTETSRRIIMSTVSFWKDQLGALPPRTTQVSKEREIVASMYDPDATRRLTLMRNWMNEHPTSDDADAFSMYANALMSIQDFAEAEKYLKKAIAVEPKNKGNYLVLVVVSYALGKTKDGDKNLTEYEKGTTPESFTYWYIGNRLFDIKKFNEAQKLFERAMAFPNPPPFLYYNLGSCYAVTGNRDKAFENLSKAVEVGFGTKEQYEAAENLKSLHDDSRWAQLMQKL